MDINYDERPSARSPGSRRPAGFAHTIPCTCSVGCSEYTQAGVLQRTWVGTRRTASALSGCAIHRARESVALTRSVHYVAFAGLTDN
jgi:hypothetical protein